MKKSNEMKDVEHFTEEQTGMNSKSVLFPAYVAVAGVGFLVGLTHLIGIALQRHVYFVEEYVLGLDYRDFYRASNALFSGNIYDAGRYVTPPLPALANVPFALLDMHLAIAVVLALSMFAVLGGYALATRIFFQDLSLRNTIARAGVLTFVLSSPFYFLIDRGNIDGFVVLFMVIAILWVERHPWLAGVMVTLAIGFKVYPVLLLIPLVIYRKRKVLASVLISSLVMVGLTPHLWGTFIFDRMWYRSNWFHFKENTSLFGIFRYVGDIFQEHGRTISEGWLFGLTLLTYAILMGLLIWFDMRRRKIVSSSAFHHAAFLYFPFMVAVPKLTLQYCLIIVLFMLPFICFWWQKDLSIFHRRSLKLMLFGVILTQFPAIAWRHMTGRILMSIVPSIGLLVLMIACVLFVSKVYVDKDVSVSMRPDEA